MPASKIDASTIRVAGTGELFLAAAGTVIPVDITDATLTGYTGTGYTTDAGVVLSKSDTKTGVNSWQSLTPTRYIYTGRELHISATFQQTIGQIVKKWLNTGAFAQVGTSGQYRADVATTPVDQLFAVFVRWVDGAITSALHVPKVSVGATGDVTLAKTAEQAWQITFDAQAPDGGSTVLASFVTSDGGFATS